MQQRGSPRRVHAVFADARDRAADRGDGVGAGYPVHGDRAIGGDGDCTGDWDHRASEFARTELAGITVRMGTDPAADRRGSYGRLLVYVYADGENFNLDLIEQRYARMYDSTFSERSRFAAAE